MTQDDIKRMAREQGLSEYMQGAVATFFQIGLEEGAEAEREACAKVCENISVNIELSRRMAAVKVNNFYGSIIRDAEKEIEKLHGIYAASIRARGQK
jgi:flagellar biosynthesis/type III secretory pathway protein FliH